MIAYLNQNSTAITFWSYESMLFYVTFVKKSVFWAASIYFTDASLTLIWFDFICKNRSYCQCTTHVFVLRCVLDYLNNVSVHWYTFHVFNISVFDVLSQFAMLYMLLSLSLGWTLGTTYRNTHLKMISKKPAAKVVGVLAVIQVFFNSSTLLF